MNSLSRRVSRILSVPRFLSSTSKRDKHMEKRKAVQQRLDRLSNKGGNEPDFQQLMRNLYKLAHPDIIRSSNIQYATVNDQSFQLLNGILSTIKTVNEFPPSIKQKIPFYLRITGAEGQYNCVELDIRTAGGDCRHQLRKSFELFFSDAGIHKGPFAWGKDYFPSEFEGQVEEAEEK